MKAKKKLISILLTVSMMLTMFPFAAFAQDANDAGNVAESADVVLPKDVNEASFGDNTVYYAGKYYETLVEALKTAAGVEDAVLYCKPGAKVGSMTHGHVCASMTVYGNDAWVEGGENEFEVDTYKGNNCQDHKECPGLQGDITLTINNLNNSGVWGQRTSNHTINVVMNNCKNAERVYISNATGVTNITINGNTYTGNLKDTDKNVKDGCAIYSNAPGAIKIENCQFDGVPEPINLNNMSDNKQTITVSNTTFNNCATTDIMNSSAKEQTWASGIRVLSTAEGGSSVLNVDNCTFTYDEGKEKANGDILLGDGRNGKTSNDAVTLNIVNTEADVQMQKPGYYTADGSTDASKLKTAIVKKSATASAFSIAEAFKVAQIGENFYSSLADAVAAANTDENALITLLQDVVVTETVKPEKNMTIDFNGKTIKGDDARVFQVLAGTLNLTGKGTVTTVIPENGKLLNTSSVIRVGDNVAEGKATNNVAAGIIIGKDVTIEAPDTYGVGLFGNKTVESAEINGTIHSVSKAALGGNGSTTHGETTMVINDTARLTADKAGAIYHPQAGTLTINGGEIIGTGGIEFKGGNAEIAINGNPLIKSTGTVSHEENNNGTSTDGYAIAVVDNKNYAGGTTVNIAGGRIVGPMTVVKDNGGADKKGSITVNGGYFTENPSKYVAGGKAAVESNLAGFNWMIADATNPDIKPAVGEPDVTVSDKIAETDKEKVAAAAKSVEATGLDDFAASAAQDVTAQQKTAAKAALKAEVSGVNDTHIYTQAYLDIDATAYDAQAGTMTLDITPMVQVVASTADEAKAIQLTGDHKNAVILKGSQKEMVAKGTVVITVTLPEGFVNNTNDIYVQHKGYEYTAKVSDTNTYTATFTNPHGFSPFTFSKTSQAKVKIGNQSYTSLQAAVDAAKDGETITLLNTLTDADLQVTVSGDSRTINFKNDTGEEKTLNINGGKLTIANGKTASYQYTASTGGGVVTRYDVTLADTDNGTITATHKRASKNSTVTITATPADGYVVDAVTVTEKDGDKVEVTKKDDNKYTFKMPASDVTVKVTFKVAPTEPEQPSGLPFTDVAKDAWYFPAVEYVFNNGLMNGTTATTFAPNVELNRAMMAAVLYNMEGGPACDKSGLFSDVADGKWYTDAVNWAASNNIVSGMPDGTYAPDQALTREQMASILYRYAEYKGIDVSARADLSTFTDGTTVSPWAQDVVQWAVAEKLMSGNGTELQPKGTASRAQVATVLMNYCENVAK